ARGLRHGRAQSDLRPGRRLSSGRRSSGGRCCTPRDGRCSVPAVTLVTSFTELVGCRVPIQQAPMGSVSTPDLAVAVADAGGVGTITALGMPPDVLDAMLAAMSARTQGVLAVNFLTEQIDRESVAAAAGRVRLIDF